MVWKRLISVCFLILTLCRISYGQAVVKQVIDAPANFCISESEWKLYRMINEYRRQYDLPAIPLSKSLCFVAATHAKDLALHHSEDSPCNFHSWSDKGAWKPFCYPADENKKNSVWDKPRELSKYNNKGYEIVYWENSDAVIDSIINFWRSMEYFNSFLMNTGKWQGKTWNAIGISIYENYALAWFGEVPDPEGVPDICGQAPVKPSVKKDSTTKVKPGKSPAPVVVAPQSSPIVAGKYYVIVKSQVTLDVANKFVIDLNSRGFKDARVLSNDNKIRVSIYEADDRAEATRLLSEAKKSFKDAWLFKN
jgi:hypothetical protein